MSHPPPRTSPGGNSANSLKEKEGVSAKIELRVNRAGGEDSVSLAEAEEAVKKIYVITGEHDASGVIAKWEQRGANMSVWQVCVCVCVCVSAHARARLLVRLFAALHHNSLPHPHSGPC